MGHLVGPQVRPSHGSAAQACGQNMTHVAFRTATDKQSVVFPHSPDTAPLVVDVCFLLFAPLGRELGGFSEWIFEVDPFIIAGELEQPQNIRWDIVRQMALYMVIIGQIDNLNRVEHIQQYTGCWAV